MITAVVLDVQEALLQITFITSWLSLMIARLPFTGTAFAIAERRLKPQFDVELCSAASDSQVLDFLLMTSLYIWCVVELEMKSAGGSNYTFLLGLMTSL